MWLFNNEFVFHPFFLSLHLTSLFSLVQLSKPVGEAAGVWRCLSRWTEQRSPSSHPGYSRCAGWVGHPGHLQHTGHCAPHLPTWLHPHVAPLTRRCPPHDLSDPGIAARDPGVSPRYSCDANDPNDAWIGGRDEDGASSPGIHTP